eukprot:9498772-Pyramimonas_sp.AAC.1
MLGMISVALLILEIAVGEAPMGGEAKVMEHHVVRAWDILEVSGPWESAPRKLGHWRAHPGGGDLEISWPVVPACSRLRGLPPVLLRGSRGLPQRSHHP